MKTRALVLIAILVFATQFAWGAMACACADSPRVPASSKVAASCPMSGAMNCQCCPRASGAASVGSAKSCEVQVAAHGADTWAPLPSLDLSADLPQAIWFAPVPEALLPSLKAMDPPEHRARPPDLADHLLRAPPFS